MGAPCYPCHRTDGRSLPQSDAGITVCSLLALSGNPAAPEFVRFWTIADKARFSPGAVCLLLVQSGPGSYLKFLAAAS